jgi:hypothetical protein
MTRAYRKAVKTRPWLLGVALLSTASACDAFKFDEPRPIGAGSDAANMGGVAGQPASAGAKAGSADTGSGGHAGSRDEHPGRAEPAAGAAGLEASDAAAGGAAAGSAAAGGAAAGSAAAGGAAAGDAAAGDAAAGGSNLPQPLDVHGRIVNFWSYPLVDVVVHIGTQSDATDTNGDFVISGVTAPYDVWFTTRAGLDQTWWFQGVSRVDPTFRVYRGGSEGSSAVLLNLTGRADNAALQTALTIGSPFGNNFRLFDWEGEGLYLNAYLNGPLIAAGTAHALTFFNDPISGLPAQFVAYATHAVAIDLDKAYSDEQTLDLTAPTESIAVSNVSGFVELEDAGEHVNSAWLSFSSNGYIPLGQETTTSEASFSYPVPALPDVTLTVAAFSNAPPGQLRLAHRGGLLGGISGVELRLPEAPIALTPAVDATIDEDTVFSWQTESAVSVLQLRQGFSELFVVTTAKSVKLPRELLEEARFEALGTGVWGVETHGPVPDMDAATGPLGFLDALSSEDFDYRGAPGPASSEGSFAVSRLSTFKLAE